MKAILALEDGTIFEGRGFGASGECYGEVVFNTSMAGYQEILTDPSYKGQIVTMTYPLIGNYGTNAEDVESRKIFVEGFVVREASNIASSWRAQEAAGQQLPSEGAVLMTVSDGDKQRALDIARDFRKMGFVVLATEGTHRFLTAGGIESGLILKMHEGRPNIVDAIKNSGMGVVG